MKINIDLQMHSVRSLSRAEDMFSAVLLQCDMLPEYLPQKFGWYEPMNLPFDQGQLGSLIPPDLGGRADTVHWKRSGRQRATGSWWVGWRKKHEQQMPSSHARTDLMVYDTCYQDKLLAYLKAASTHNQCDFGFLDGDTERYRQYAAQADVWGGHLSVFTHVLSHWLPDMFWATVLGPAYVRMFGKERVLSVPAYIVEELGPETVYLQLTPRLEDVENDFEKVMAARERVKQHLGIEAFFQSGNAYDRNEHPELAGKVFRVPKFYFPQD